ncbi:hypothetical protein BU17DRAFT_72029 [Hysterangium stoloniferum]|nr:hypothetical protein BU17DRAFT_72029 [Hysterangium stoloniferum]
MAILDSGSNGSLRLALVPWGYASPTLAILGCSKMFPNLKEKVLCGRCYKLDQNPSEPEKKIILIKQTKGPIYLKRTLDFEETASKHRLHKPLPPNDSLLKGYEVCEKTRALKKQNKGEIINIRYSLAQIIPGKNKPVQISLPMQKEPFDVQDDANEVIDKILSNGKNYYDHYSNCDIKLIWDQERVIFVVVNGTNLQDHNFVDVDVIKLGGKSIGEWWTDLINRDFLSVKDVKKNDLTLQLRLHEDVPIISDEELNTSGRMDNNKKITRANGIRSLGAKHKNASSEKGQI